MPNRDRTGPDGRGPRTGRGFGDCDPEKTVNELTRLAGDRPRRRGRRNRGR